MLISVKALEESPGRRSLSIRDRNRRHLRGDGMFVNVWYRVTGIHTATVSELSSVGSI